MNIRADAAAIVTQVVVQKKSLDDALPDYLKKYDEARDKALLQELSYGTLRWHHKLDAITKSLLTKTSKKTDALVHSLILVGLYQLLYLRIPHHATLFETVAATHTIKKLWAKGLVNAVLRNFIRGQEKILAQIENTPNTNEFAGYFNHGSHTLSKMNLGVKPSSERQDPVWKHNGARFTPSVNEEREERGRQSINSFYEGYAKYSHPEWLIKLLQKSWPKNWEEILNANNDRPPLHLRVNLSKISRDDYLKKLESLNIHAKTHATSKTAITLEKPVDISALPDFYRGFVSVQDLAAQYAVDLLELKPGLRVLDACAAPGGKTAHILENTPDLQELVAVDLIDKRLEMIQNNLTRLQLSATLICGDATKPLKWWDGKKFDRILLDAPCSGTGVIRRHPDIKILRQEKDINNNAALQFKLLEALWPLLNNDGILVYATCSVLPQENQMVIEKFLLKYNNAQEKPITVSWGHKVTHGIQIFPETSGSDGFYYAKILKLA